MIFGDNIYFIDAVRVKVQKRRKKERQLNIEKGRGLASIEEEGAFEAVRGDKVEKQLCNLLKTSADANYLKKGL